MTIDIRLLRTDQGGDVEAVRESQRKRYADVGLVDEVRVDLALCTQLSETGSQQSLYR